MQQGTTEATEEAGGQESDSHSTRVATDGGTTELARIRAAIDAAETGAKSKDGRVARDSGRVARPRWRGTTKIEMNKAGQRVAVFHRNHTGNEAWTHPYEERCHACA